MPQIIYEDNHLIVAVKPPNIPTQLDDSGDEDFQTILKNYISVKYNKPGNVFLGMVQRLDRPVSGIMVFARTSKAASRLADSVRTRKIQKRYFAVVNGEVPEHGSLEHWLLKDTSKNMVTAHTREVPGSKKAVLSFKREAVAENGLSLISIDLETGRSHQTRVQCSTAGFPIWGDQRYNVSGSQVGQQIALVATGLTFEHPVKKETMNFDIPLPDRFPWTSFK
ncbi:MAG: RluA family pseudouridine synthase [Balneolales bacterium]|nr:RluA family pseudouridine synthase [Balneolales bacterium]